MNNVIPEEQTVAIIIPTYHSESHLSRCIESIVNQKHRNLEIIIIDDGNEDSATQDIVESFARTDNRIKYFFQTNSGPGPARNLGLEHVENIGKKWISFVDSDDYLEPDYISELLHISIANQSLITTVGAVEAPLMISGEDAIEWLATHRITAGFHEKILHGSLASKSLFGTWSKRGEDTIASIRTYLCIGKRKQVFVANYSFGYHYLNNPGSLTNESLTTLVAIDYVFLWKQAYAEIAGHVNAKVREAIIWRLIVEFLQMDGFIFGSKKHLSPFYLQKYQETIKCIKEHQLLKAFKPKSKGEARKARIYRFCPLFYRLWFRHP